jgi:hypothetical protein
LPFAEYLVNFATQVSQWRCIANSLPELQKKITKFIRDSSELLEIAT